MSILNDILAAIFPHRCLFCQEEMDASHGQICTRCYSQISFTRYWEYSDNNMAHHARDMQPIINNAAAMLYYDSYSREVIHRLKYRGQWRTAQTLGEVFGSFLARSAIYSSVDVIIPVPLHPLRTLQRGYNQSEYIARGMAQQMGIKVDTHSLCRQHYTSAQARKYAAQRWESPDGIFSMRRPEVIAGKHILLVDDVYTSGATIYRCVEAISRTEVDCQISVATLATPRG